MTDSGGNGEKQKSRDPKNIATLLLVIIAVIMMALLVKNCVTDRAGEPTNDSESAELTGNSGYADQSEYIIDYTGNNTAN